VEAICPNSPGCCGAGCATPAGTLETGFGGARFEDFLSPRGIIEVTIVLKYGQNLAPFTRIPLENVIEPKRNLN